MSHCDREGPRQPGVAALVIAAGLSSRMKEFKPLLRLGGIPMAERVVRAFRDAGIDEIVMVTGYRATELERALSGVRGSRRPDPAVTLTDDPGQESGLPEITFLRNPDYACSDMFTSAKIGLSYLEGRCDRLFFCPADIPLFSGETARLLLKERADIVIPSHTRKAGHPILLRADLIPAILAYTGKGGMKGALRALPAERVYVETDDAGAFLDADTPEDFAKLEQLLRSWTGSF